MSSCFHPTIEEKVTSEMYFVAHSGVLRTYFDTIAYLVGKICQHNTDNRTLFLPSIDFWTNKTFLPATRSF